MDYGISIHLLKDSSDLKYISVLSEIHLLQSTDPFKSISLISYQAFLALLMLAGRVIWVEL